MIVTNLLFEAADVYVGNSFFTFAYKIGICRSDAICVEDNLCFSRPCVNGKCNKEYYKSPEQQMRKQCYDNRQHCKQNKPDEDATIMISPSCDALLVGLFNLEG